jgi:hypothetical protein
VIRRRARKAAGPADPAMQAAAEARREAIQRAQQELGGALVQARSAMSDAIDRAGLATRGGAQPMLDAVTRSQRAVSESLGQLGRGASEEDTAKAVAEAARLTSEAVSSGLNAEQQSLKAAQEGITAALQATSEAVAAAGKLIGSSLQKP